MKFKTLVFFILFTATSVWAQVEHYTDRPHILKLEPMATTQKNWERLQWGQVEFVAQMLGLYKTETLYFLARDGEYFYDLALLLTEGHPELKNRLRLINVSRGNQDSPNLKKYLIQEGLTAKSIEETGVVFVDTGFLGSIGKLIISFYPNSLASKMKIHLVESDDPNIPQSRIFRTQKSMGVEDFEGMPRFFDRSDDIVEMNGRLVPISPGRPEGFVDDEGEVSKRRAMKYMQSTVAFAQRQNVQKHFFERLNQWKFVQHWLEDHGRTLAQLQQLLKKVKSTWSDTAKTAFIEDFSEVFRLYSKRLIKPDESFFSLKKDWSVAPLEILKDFEEKEEQFAKRALRVDVQDLAFLTLAASQAAKKGSDYYPIPEIIDSMNYYQVLAYFREVEMSRGADYRDRILQIFLGELDEIHPVWIEYVQSAGIKNDLVRARIEKMISKENVLKKKNKELKCRAIFF